jgi:hypothetical protein
MVTSVRRRSPLLSATGGAPRGADVPNWGQVRAGTKPKAETSILSREDASSLGRA